MPTVDLIWGERGKSLGHESGLALDVGFPKNFAVFPKPNEHGVGVLGGDVPGDAGGGGGGLADVTEGGDRGEALSAAAIVAGASGSGGDGGAFVATDFFGAIFGFGDRGAEDDKAG